MPLERNDVFFIQSSVHACQSCILNSTKGKSVNKRIPGNSYVALSCFPLYFCILNLYFAVVIFVVSWTYNVSSFLQPRRVFNLTKIGLSKEVCVSVKEVCYFSRENCASWILGPEDLQWDLTQSLPETLTSRSTFRRHFMWKINFESALEKDDIGPLSWRCSTDLGTTLSIQVKQHFFVCFWFLLSTFLGMSGSSF